jgi:tRNA(fMet)-specific endonuclease VapC
LKYILDSNTWISLLRWQNAGVLSRLQQLPAEDVALCSIVLAELWYGAERGDERYKLHNYTLVDQLEAKYESIPFDNLAARDYAIIRGDLSRLGMLIVPNDTMIAAIARSRGATLVTRNIAEFNRVPSLIVEDWQTH